MKPIIFYHANCADGFGAAYAAWKFFKDDAEYVAIKHGQIKSLDDVDLLGDIQGRVIYILDFSFAPKVMNYIIERANFITLLDHHKTAFEQFCPGVVLTPETTYASRKKNFCLTLKNNQSGAMIAWNYFNEDEVPMLVRYIDDYDRWVFALTATKAFNKALWLEAPWTFERFDEIAQMTSQELDAFTAPGAALLKDAERRVKAAAEHWKLVDLGVGDKGFAVNAPAEMASALGHELAVQSGTFGLVWSVTDTNIVKCSLRSNAPFDVSSIAKYYGGGGHAQAAGFEMPLMDFVTKVLM